LTGADVDLVASALRSVPHVEQVLAGEEGLPRMLRPAVSRPGWAGGSSAPSSQGSSSSPVSRSGRARSPSRVISRFSRSAAFPRAAWRSFRAAGAAFSRVPPRGQPGRRPPAERCSWRFGSFRFWRGDRSPVRPSSSPDGRGGRPLLLRRGPAFGGGVPPRMEGGSLRPEMTRGTRRILAALLGAVVSLCILCPAAAPAARDIAGELRKERGRLLDMKEREEKTAAELTEALRKEKLSKGRVGELQERLKRQRSLLSRIDRNVSGVERTAGAGWRRRSVNSRRSTGRPGPASSGRLPSPSPGSGPERGILVSVRPGTGTALHAPLPRGKRGGCRPDHPGTGAEGG